MREYVLVGIAFLLGFLAAFNVNVIGVLGLNEIFLIILTPIVLPKIVRSRSIKRYRKVLILGLLYLAGQIVSDLYRHSAPQDYLRGWARIGLTLMAFSVAVAWFVRSARVLLAYAIGALLVGPVVFFQQGAIYGDENVYKLSLGSTVSLASFTFICIAPKALRVPASVMPVLAGILALWRGGRSLAGITFFALLTYWTGRLRLMRGRQIPRRKIIIVGSVFALSGWGIFEGYRYSASSGLLGEAALLKYETQIQQLSGETFTVLSGRQELLFTGPKILSSPLIGQGSWAKDVDYVWNRSLELGLDPDGMVTANTAEPGLIPAHSHIFTGWLEAGLAGAIFWGYAVFMAIDVLIRQKFIRHPELAPVINYIIVLFVWDMFFSPYGGERRVWNGVILAWIASIYYKNKLEAGSENGSSK